MLAAAAATNGQRELETRIEKMETADNNNSPVPYCCFFSSLLRVSSDSLLFLLLILLVLFGVRGGQKERLSGQG